MTAPLSIAEVAQVAYIEFQIRLDDEARQLAATGKPLMAAIVRKQAAIAYRAAKAEADDPEPDPVRQCRICHGVRTCDVAVRP